MQSLRDAACVGAHPRGIMRAGRIEAKEDAQFITAWYFAAVLQRLPRYPAIVYINCVYTKSNVCSHAHYRDFCDCCHHRCAALPLLVP